MTFVMYSSHFSYRSQELQLSSAHLLLLLSQSVLYLGRTSSLEFAFGSDVLGGILRSGVLGGILRGKCLALYPPFKCQKYPIMSLHELNRNIHAEGSEKVGDGYLGRLFLSTYSTKIGGSLFKAISTKLSSGKHGYVKPQGKVL